MVACLEPSVVKGAAVGIQNVDLTQVLDEETEEILANETTIDSYSISANQVMIETDGVKYYLNSQIVNGCKLVTMSYNDKQIELRTQGNIISATTYEVVEKVPGLKKRIKCDYNEFEINQYVVDQKEVGTNDVALNQATWNTRVDTPAEFGKVYYYRSGTSSYGNAYYQVGTYKNKGTKTTYNIPYYKLSKYNKSLVKEYKKYVQKSEKNMSLAKASAGSTTVGTIVGIFLLIISSVSPGLGVILTAITLIVGGYGAAIKCVYDSYYARINAIDEYASIIKLGKKATYQ